MKIELLQCKLKLLKYHLVVQAKSLDAMVEQLLINQSDENSLISELSFYFIDVSGHYK